MAQLPINENDVVNNLYDRMRERIAHEDHLVHNRLMWMLTLNGFLFSAFTITYTSFFVENADTKQRILDLRYILGSVGIFSCFLVLLGVSAAFYAMRRNVIQFKKLHKSPKYLPDLIGGRLSGFFGMGCAILFPILIGGAWILLADMFQNIGFISLALVGIIIAIALVIYPLFAGLESTSSASDVSGDSMASEPPKRQRRVARTAQSQG